MSAKADRTAKLLTGPQEGDRVRCDCPERRCTMCSMRRTPRRITPCTGVVTAELWDDAVRVRWDGMSSGWDDMLVASKRLVVLDEESK